MPLDPRTRDAIREIPEALETLTERIEALELYLIDIHKFTRSTNESVVRKYGGGEKNAISKMVANIKGEEDES